MEREIPVKIPDHLLNLGPDRVKPRAMFSFSSFWQKSLLIPGGTIGFADFGQNSAILLLARKFPLYFSLLFAALSEKSGEDTEERPLRPLSFPVGHGEQVL